MDGIPSSEVYDIEYDDKGYIWLTTDRGVARYDGYDFKTYSLDDGLLCNTNFKIYKDSHNYLWFTGFNHTLSCWDGHKFINHPINEELIKIKNSWIDDFIQINDSIYLFHQSDYQNKKIFRYNINTNEITSEDVIYDSHLKIYHNQKGENFIFSKEIDSHVGSGIILNDTLKLFYIDQREHSQSYNSNNVIDSLQKLAKGLINFEDLFHLPDSRKLKIEFNSTINCLEENSIIVVDSINGSIRGSIYEKESQKVYYFTTLGLKEYDLTKKELEAVTYLKDYKLSYGIKDYKGNYWLTTTDQGILFIPNFNIKKIHTDRLKYRIVNLGSIDDILILKDSKGNLFRNNQDNQLEKIISFKCDFFKGYSRLQRYPCIFKWYKAIFRRQKNRSAKRWQFRIRIFTKHSPP